MPIYEYRCNACNHHFDAMQKVNDEPLKECPCCAESSVIRLVSAAGFQLKGTGWYATDFKNKGKSETVGDKAPSSESSSTETKKPEGCSTTSGSESN